MKNGSCGVSCGCATTGNQNLDLVGIASGKVGKAQGISGSHYFVWPDKHAVDGPYNEKPSEEIIADLRLEIDRLTAQSIYSCSPDVDVHYVQGDNAFELCDLVTAKEVQVLHDKVHGGDSVWFSKAEVLILQRLAKGEWVGPAGAPILDKIKAVKP